MVRLYRITAARYAEDHSGRGAYLYGGRWNSKSQHALYAAQTVSLAMLEVLVHINKPPPRAYQLITYTVDPSLIADSSVEYAVPSRLDMKSLVGTREIGDTFLQSHQRPVLAIPSIMHAFENNYLINPNHKLSDQIEVVDLSSFTFEERFFTHAQN
jgi:RES domain-containing protein